MIGLGIGLALLVTRFRLLSKMIRWISRLPGMDWSPLFLLTLSLDPNAHQIYLLNLLNRLCEGLIILGLISGFSQLFGFETSFLAIFSVAAVMGVLLYLTGRIKAQQGVLLERLQRFVYFYEMELMRGTHQYLALREADRRTGLLEHYETVPAYINAVNQMYSYVPWMVIKKLAILLERNLAFSDEDLSVEFIELSQELHTRYAQGERLKLERRENLMLLPMTINMLLMIMYLIAPFIRELF